jgi:hypothetical protein
MKLPFFQVHIMTTTTLGDKCRAAEAKGHADELHNNSEILHKTLLVNAQLRQKLYGHQKKN